VTTDGTPAPGETVSCSTGTWSGSPTYTYQWQKDTVSIGGATSSSYVLQAGDASHSIRCVVTATNAGGGASANSNAITPTAPPSGTTYRDAVLALNPVAYWRLKDLTDSGPNGFTLTQSTNAPGNTVGLVNDTNEGAKKWTDDLQQTLSVAHDARLNLKTAFTLIAWLQTDFVPSPFKAIIKNGHYLMQLKDIGGGVMKFTTRVNTASGNFWDADGTTTVTTAGKYMVALTFDGTNGRTYVNGNLEGTTVNVTTAPQTTVSHFCMGKDLDSGFNGWYGTIDEVSVHGAVLTQSQLAALYAAGTA